MRTKKLKKRKLKCKKLLKLQKFSVKKNKSDINNFEMRYFSSNSAQDITLLNCKKNLRFLGEKYISKVKYFLQIRELYFDYLQRVVFDNCKFYNSVVPENIFENLALELEQNALLACLQTDLYEKLMNKIIIDIENSTEENQIHMEVKKLLSNLPQKDLSSSCKTEKTLLIPSETETYSIIPVISNSTSENSSVYNTETEPVINNLEPSNLSSECVDSCLEHDINQVVEPKETCPTSYNSPTHINDAIKNNINFCENFITDNHPASLVNNIVIKVSPVENETLLEARNQLQKSIEKNLKEVEKMNKQKKDEKQRAYIAQILEGDDSADEKFCDSFSDSENDYKENVDETNLVERLQKMRELFGLDEEEKPVQTVTNKLKIKPQKPKLRPKCPAMWKYEKVIQLYKLSLLSSETTFERRSRNRMLFLEFFGADSDEEHELEYLSEEKYKGSCTERISSWVVKYLMPYYRDKKIIGKNVFKSLGHHVSKTIVDKIQYPDEWTVKYFVSKFFPPQKKYLSEADIFAFEIEEL